jgi:hypothetical protein
VTVDVVVVVDVDVDVELPTVRKSGSQSPSLVVLSRKVRSSLLRRSSFTLFLSRSTKLSITF